MDFEITVMTRISKSSAEYKIPLTPLIPEVKDVDPVAFLAWNKGLGEGWGEETTKVWGK